MHVAILSQADVNHVKVDLRQDVRGRVALRYASRIDLCPLLEQNSKLGDSVLGAIQRPEVTDQGVDVDVLVEG